MAAPSGRSGSGSGEAVLGMGRGDNGEGGTSVGPGNWRVSLKWSAGLICYSRCVENQCSSNRVLCIPFLFGRSEVSFLLVGDV